MKLKSCHINGFGIYKNKDFEFNNLEQFYSENGTGKSTLADFIKYMLYDFPKKEIRTKYAPFDGSLYGGSLIIEVDGKEYRVEKTFGRSSSKDDLENVYINNSLSDIKGLGNYLFKIDDEGFIRTIFINGKDLSISSSSSINSKLNSLVAKTDDEFDVEDIIKKLNDVNKYYGTRATTSSKLLNAKNHLDELKIQKDELTNLKSSLEKSYDELNNKKENLDLLNEDIKNKEEINKHAAFYESYVLKKDTIDKSKEQLDLINKKYKRILSKEELSNIKNDLEEYNRLKDIINNSHKFNNEELNRLSKIYEKNPLNKEKLNEIDADIRNLELKKSQINNDNLLIISEEDEFRFKGIDVLSEIDDAKLESKKLNEINEKIIASKEIKEETKPFNFYVITIFGSVVLILGIVLLALNQIIAGSIVSGLGFVVSLISLILALKPKKNISNNNDSLTYEYHLVEKKLSNILARYRYNDDGYQAQLIHLENDYNLYKEKLDKNKSLKEANDLLEKDIHELKIKIEEFFDKYLDKYEEYREALRIVNRDYERFNILMKNKEESLKNNLNNQNRFIELENKLKPIIEEFNLSFDTADSFFFNMNVDLEKTSFILDSIQNNKKELDEYVSINNINPEEKYVKIDIQDLYEKRNILNDEYIALNKAIEGHEKELERLPIIEDECENYQELIKKYKYKNKIYNYVIESLKKADASLKEKYIKPLKDGFKIYEDALNAIFKNRVTFDNDFNLKLDIDGKLVSDMHLSQGEATIAMLCYRLALIDNMYEEKPFIILDDPFINLDDNNLKNALNLIKELSNKTQIIYFTCVQNRKV